MPKSNSDDKNGTIEAGKYVDILSHLVRLQTGDNNSKNGGVLVIHAKKRASD